MTRVGLLLIKVGTIKIVQEPDYFLLKYFTDSNSPFFLCARMVSAVLRSHGSVRDWFMAALKPMRKSLCNQEWEYFLESVSRLQERCLCPCAPRAHKTGVYSVHSHQTALDCKVNHVWWERRSREGGGEGVLVSCWWKGKAWAGVMLWLVVAHDSKWVQAPRTGHLSRLACLQ